MDCAVLILGPVELRTPDRRVALGAAKEALALAALAVDAGKPVSLDTLIRRIWDDDPPPKARASVHSYATRIRKRLRDLDGRDDHLVHEAHTYTLRIAPDSVDCRCFERLTDQAVSLSESGDEPRALSLLRQAEALWRGEPLAGLTGSWVESTRTHAEERRLSAISTRMGIELRAGHFSEVISELCALVDQYPTDETFVGHLVVARYGCGRQGDALRTYETARRRLNTELGAEPGEALSRLHRLVLNGAPVEELLGLRPGAPATPHNLPSHGDLVGREEEMRLLQAPPAEGGVIALQAISGMAGIGKSLLALHVARRLGGQFPAGQIYLDLRAHSPGETPLSPEAALTTLLRLLGVPATSIPQSLEELSSYFRTLLSSRRAVIILDDAVGPDQIRPMLPGGSPSLIIITSRRRLAGLPGVRTIFLDVLPTEDAIALFVRLVGPERARDHGEVATIVRLCGHLPLAVELAAGRLLSRPSWDTSHLSKRLSNSHGRLGEIRDGYEIARAFEMSYNTLSRDEQTTFRLLSLRMGTEFGPHASAALTALPLDRTERILESLLDAHLIQEPAPDRYRFHDLLAEYALSLTAVEDSDEDRTAAVQRLISFYLHAADRADRLINPRRPRLDPCLPAPQSEVPTWHSAAEAKRWLSAERGALISAERHARKHGAPRQAALIAHCLAGFLDSEGYWSDARQLLHCAAEHWQESGDPLAEARALIDLAAIESQAGTYERAEETGRRGLALARAAGDTTGEEEALRVLGLLHWNTGRLDEARILQQKALEICLESDDTWRVARARNNLGITLLQLGRHTEAMTCFRIAHDGFLAHGDKRGEAQTANNLGEIYLHMGERDSARAYFSKVLGIVLEAGSRSEQAIAKLNIADTLNIPNEYDEALALYREALFIFRRIGDRRNETVTLNSLGTAYRKANRHHESASHHQMAFDMALKIGATQEEIQALRGLGLTELSTGRLRPARQKLQEALEAAERISATELAARTRTDLAELCLRTGRRAEALDHMKLALATLEGLDKFESIRIRERMLEIDSPHLHE